MSLLKVICVASILSLLDIGRSEAATNTTFGKFTCTDWIKERAKSPEIAAGQLAAQAWLMGFLSGVNVFTPGDILANVDSQLVFDWTDKYCIKSPSDEISDAAADLLQKLAE